MFEVTDEIVARFSNKINFDGITTYFISYSNFFQNDYPEIVAFFSGQEKTIESDRFDNLQALVDTSKVIEENIILKEFQLTTYEDWEMVDYLEELRTKLLFTTKVSKFLRSTRNPTNFSNKFNFNYTLKDNETLEKVSNTILGDTTDNQNSWTDIAIENRLLETDYTNNSNNNLQLSIELGASNNASIRGVIDNIIGEKILGLDLDKKITFLDDDLKVLAFRETAAQAVAILITLFKGDIPEFLTFGRTSFAGGSAAQVALSFNSVIRELTQIFTSDDTLTRFEVLDVVANGSDYIIKFQVSTRFELIIKNSISL